MLPVGNGSDKVKQSNEIKFASILLDNIPIAGKDITSDALQTQTNFANYLVDERNAHFYMSVKDNQPTLLADIKCLFEILGTADYEDNVSIAHGRIEQRKIWVSSELNDYVLFPHVAQVYRIEKESIDKKTGKISHEVAYGITSRTQSEASPKIILHKVRGHWGIEVCHYIIDWIYDEDRSTIRTGYGPENITRMRRFAVGLVKSKAVKSISKKMRQLNKNTRGVFDYLKMTKNSQKLCRV